MIAPIAVSTGAAGDLPVFSSKKPAVSAQARGGFGQGQVNAGAADFPGRGQQHGFAGNHGFAFLIEYDAFKADVPFFGHELGNGDAGSEFV